MTVVLALRCADGMVMGSDSQASETNGTRFTVDKIYRLNSRSVWGATGAVSVIDKLKDRFEAAGPSGELEKAADIGTCLHVYTKPILDACYSGFIWNPPNSVAGSIATTSLSCGYAKDGAPFIIEVDHQCQVTNYGVRGLHAVGSGGAFASVASALLSHFDLQNRSYTQGLVAAWRVLNIVIETSAHGVGHPIDLWQILPGSEPHRLTIEERAEVENQVGGWQALEAEALDAVFGQTNADQVAEEPLPPDLGEAAATEPPNS